MKKLTNILGAFALAGLFFACGGNAEKPAVDQAQAQADSLKKAEAEAKKARESRGFHEYDDDFQVLVGSYDGVMRGLEMGASLADVKAAEAKEHTYTSRTGEERGAPMPELLEEKADMLKYRLNMLPREDAIIVYGFTDGKLSQVSITVHVDDNVHFEAMEEDFISFFTHKHGAPTTIDGKKEVWKVKNSATHEIDIIDKQTDTKFYLEVLIK